jgi:hypothetical protein
VDSVNAPAATERSSNDRIRSISAFFSARSSPERFELLGLFGGEVAVFGRRRDP